MRVKLLSSLSFLPLVVALIQKIEEDALKQGLSEDDAASIEWSVSDRTAGTAIVTAKRIHRGPSEGKELLVYASLEAGDIDLKLQLYYEPSTTEAITEALVQFAQGKMAVAA